MRDNPFEMFVRTILSQNTNDKNRDKAYNRLKEHYGELTPEKLAKSSLKTIEELIQVAGLHRQKSGRIYSISKDILENHGGKIETILNLPYKKAREKLMAFKGIGFKTADIMLLFYCNHPFIPIDTHITRVSKRLGFVEQDAKYETIRRTLEGLITRDSKIYKESHLLFIELGRDSCNAVTPRCSKCIVEDLCPKKIVKKVRRPAKRKSRKNQIMNPNKRKYLLKNLRVRQKNPQKKGQNQDNKDQIKTKLKVKPI